MLILFILLFIHPVLSCSWPSSDVLFIIDGTSNVNVYEHLNEIDFIRKILGNMEVGLNSVRVALAQYTPRYRSEFGLDALISRSVVEDKLQGISYTPCNPATLNCTPPATLNTIAKQSLLPGNRKPAPDIVVLIGSSKYSVPHTGPLEVLFSPISPIHTFQISIGGTPPDDKFEAAATFIPMHAEDFTSMEKLVDPLCESVNFFVGHNVSGFGPLCLLVTVILAILLLILLCVFFYGFYKYRNDVESYRNRVREFDRRLKSQNEYFTSKLHTQMEEQLAVSKKHADDLQKQQELFQTQNIELQRHWNKKSPPSQPTQPIIIPYYPPNDKYDHGKDDKSSIYRHSRDGETPTIHFKFDGKEMEIKNGRISTRILDERRSIADQLVQNEDENRHQGHNNNSKTPEPSKEEIPPEPQETSDNKNNRSTSPVRKNHENEVNEDDKSSFEGSSESGSVDSTDNNERLSYLPPNHPARTLPPVDILFLVDSSSSIGITNFDAMKENINSLLDNVDIAPGRSKIALIQYAQEANVVFGFHKYYSPTSVKRGVQRMSYTGGATMLAKALSFAAGVLYNEQNMKNTKKKHKLMPTPRHDRLQILCLVSDGASDDNIEKAANYIHEKLQVKVLGMVSKSFNKDKLLPVTKFEGSIFVMTQTESMSIWIWRQQKLWADNYGRFFQKE